MEFITTVGAILAGLAMVAVGVYSLAAICGPHLTANGGRIPQSSASNRRYNHLVLP